MKPLLQLTFLLLFATQLKAQICNYLAYEGFNYNNNSSLHNAQGGSGFSQPWLIQTNNNTVQGYSASSNSLLYSNLATFSNKSLGGYEYLTVGRRLDISQNGSFAAYYDTINNNGIALNGTTLYFSVLLQKNENNEEPVFVELNGDNVGWVIFSQPHVGFGYYGTSSNVGGQKRWSLRINNNIYPTNVLIVTGTPTLLVLSVSFNTLSQHSISMWVNPASIGGVAPPPTLTQTSTENLWVKSIAYYGGDNPNSSAIDEIRLASTYQCVTPTTSTTVNVPPTANFTASTTDGQAPLLITFNPSTSSDNDGSIVSYEWNFNDGLPPLINNTNANVVHTFNTLGIIPVSLKVTDNFGATNVFEQTVIVRDMNNSFSCQPSMSLLNAASCGQNNGTIRINNIWNNLINNFELRNSANALMPLTGADTYNNLPFGAYTLNISGNYGCSDVKTLYVPTDSSTCQNWEPNICEMQMGMNLNFPTYYTTERPFKNLFLFSSGFFTTYSATPWIESNKIGEISTDTAGYPLSIPYTDATNTLHVVRAVLSDLLYYPTGVNLVLKFDGLGSVSLLGNVNIISQTANRIEFTMLNDQFASLQINSSTLGNHVRNIRVTRLSDEYADLKQNPFHQAFLDRLQPFKAIRFMNWQKTNASTVVTWLQRTQQNSFNQSDNAGYYGVAYEYMIQLCNTLNKDAWICIPHQADDNYITQLATLFSQRLNPNLTIYIEYSNEVWNWGFLQSKWVADNGANNLSYPRKYAERASRNINLFRNTFSGANKNRVKRVLGTQLTYTWVGEEILAHANPNDFDYFSPSSYFGISGSACEASLGAASTATDVINCATEHFHQNYPLIKRDYLNAKLMGKQVINYEGGNHFSNFNIASPYLAANQAAQTNAQIGVLYKEVIDSLRKLDTKLCMYFVLASRLANTTDMFGHLDHIDQTAPYPVKYQVLIDNSNLKPSPYITGNLAVCNNNTYTYSTAAGVAGTTYNWTVTGGTILSMPPYSNTIQVQWNTNAIGTVTVEQLNP